MDTKLKKSNKALYGFMYFLCILSSMASLCGFILSEQARNIYIRPFPIRDFYPDIWLQYSPFSEMSMREQITIYLGIAVMCGIIALASFTYLCIVIGDRDENGKIILKGVDKIFTEFQLLFIAIMVTLSISSLNTVYYDFTLVFVVIAGIIITTAAIVVLGNVLSCVRKIKAGTLFSQSVIGIMCIVLYKTVFVGGSLMRKIILIAILGCALSASWVLAPVALILTFIFVPKWVREYEEITRGIDEVRSGNLSYKIPELKNGEFDKLASGINEISQSSNVAVQNEMKNQRMKAELISNVSHDLKTPLTSMVTYIDLLKTEGLASDSAPEYLEILDQKTSRLKQLTEDLFEAAKASSGAIPVRREKVDMLSLINQGLGEMDQGIADSGLEMIIKAELEKYYVWADGQLLWRVVENLLGNVLKYAQENTRVYINLMEQGAYDKPGMMILEVKNISRQALNIEAEELMERFKRGDESRTTDGSGLGLAIAKDLVKLQGGWLDIKIDGDLFKAVVMLEKAE